MKFFHLCVLALALGLMVSVSACGKVSAPTPIEGSGYPHSYPRR